VFDAFARAKSPAGDTDHAVIGLAHSRPGGKRNLHKLNLLDPDAVSTFFRDAKPDCELSSVYDQSRGGNQHAVGAVDGATHTSGLRGVALRALT